MAFLVIFLIVLWIRPEYRFLLFFIVGETILTLVLAGWTWKPEDLPVYLVAIAINDVALLVLGAIVVALRKWMKSRKSGLEKDAERIVEQARAEAAARGEANGGR
ncbi:MAG: hypothetical protein QM759_09495 [Terricaulis sp.]